MIGKFLVGLWLGIWACAPISAALAGGTVERSLTLASPTLGRDLAYSIYRPEQTSEPPPVLYLLHGLGGHERDWLNLGKIQATADRLIAAGTIPPMAIVMPDGGDSWYVDSTEHGSVASAYLNDLIPHVEATHGLRSDRAGRFIAGLSMGGYGALRFAILHPGVFRAGASLSGAIFPDLEVADQVSKAQINMFRGAFGSPFTTDLYNRRNFFSRLGDLKASGHRVDLFISVGDDDGFRLYEGAVALYLALKRRRLPVEMRIVDGDHNWRLWRQDIEAALRFFGGLPRTEARK